MAKWNLILSTPPPINILLADDDTDDCLLFQEALKELTITTTFKAVHDGDQLMSYFKDETNRLPTVLFLDLNIPRKNGFACLEEIKQTENLKKFPVIIISTSYDANTADLLYKNGAHYYICKPPDFLHLKKVIEHSLQLISKGKNSQPAKEEFLLSNLKSIFI